MLNQDLPMTMVKLLSPNESYKNFVAESQIKSLVFCKHCLFVDTNISDIRLKAFQSFGDAHEQLFYSSIYRIKFIFKKHSIDSQSERVLFINFRVLNFTHKHTAKGEKIIFGEKLERTNQLKRWVNSNIKLISSILFQRTH